MTLGYMTMPADFRYKEILLLGKPALPPAHPPMDTARRAKIFAPFAALRGFEEAIADKDVLYTEKAELDEAEREELDRRLGALRYLTRNGRAAKANRPVASITYFVPCADKNSDAYGARGQYQTVKDVVWKVDTVEKTVLIGKTPVPMADIRRIESDTLFGVEWEADIP